MSLDFMAVLEARVNEAAQRIEELRREGQRLEKEVKRRARPESPPPPPPPPVLPAASRVAPSVARTEKVDPAEQAWFKERDEVHRRLEALIARLEALLL